MFILNIGILLLFVHNGAWALTATATLHEDNSNITNGIITFVQNTINGSVTVTGIITGLNASSEHGFHVHTSPVSEVLPNCTAAGLHFNPYNTTHGPRTNNITNRHVGDLGNLTTDANGTVNINFNDSIIQLTAGNQSIINRTIIIHVGRDDGGMGNFSDSITTGNSGARFTCGLIKLVMDNTTQSTTTGSPSIATSSIVGLNIIPIILTMIVSYLFFY